MRKLTATVLLVLAIIYPARQAIAANEQWSGGSVLNGDWGTGSNWVSGTAPGSTSVITSTDIATFKTAIANTWGSSAANPIVINSSTQNIGSISFTTTASGYFLGSTGGNSIYLTAGQTIQMTLITSATTVTNTINAPLVLEGAYVIKNDSTSGTGTNSGILNIGGAISSASASNTTISIRGTNTNANTISGNISNGSAPSVLINKNDAGTWILSGSNSYTGTTTVTLGTLLIDGNSSNATGNVSVTGTSGATLGGSGTIGGAITVNNLATLAPGTVADSTSTLTSNNKTLTISGVDSKINMDITGTAAGNFDRIVGISTFALNGDLTLTLSGSYGTASWDLFDFAIKSGNFDTVTLAGSYIGSLTRASDTWSGTVGGQAWSFDQTTGVLAVVPEPATWICLTLSLMVCTIFRRRHNR